MYCSMTRYQSDWQPNKLSQSFFKNEVLIIATNVTKYVDYFCNEICGKTFQRQAKFGHTELSLYFQAFIAGWGTPMSQNCSTDSYGPSILKPCKFPFTFNDSPFYGCTHSDSPAALSKLCKKFNKDKSIRNQFDKTIWHPLP